ncbi:MAG: 50S ribosomal protein L15 [Spirochaetales bacterium]|nr:MAG: 50S ribosomal protein L15 [Spirochaetales bacterium]
MENFQLKVPKGATKRKKRVGRGMGSGHGSTSGRGNNGQNARSGGGVRPGFEGGQMPLFRRVARRGFSNYPFKEEYVVINLSELNNKYADGETVSMETLLKKDLIKKRDKRVKILGEGSVDKKLVVKLSKISKSAREKIEKAGGKVSGPAAGRDEDETRTKKVE